MNFSVSTGVTDEVVEVAAEVVQTVENVRLFMVRTVTEVALTVEAIRTFIVATITFLVNLVVDILRVITGKSLSDCGNFHLIFLGRSLDSSVFFKGHQEKRSQKFPKYRLSILTSHSHPV